MPTHTQLCPSRPMPLGNEGQAATRTCVDKIVFNNNNDFSQSSKEPRAMMKVMNAQLCLGQSRAAFGTLLVVVHRNSVLLRFVPPVLELGSGLLGEIAHIRQLLAVVAAVPKQQRLFPLYRLLRPERNLFAVSQRSSSSVAERDPNPQVIARSAIRHSSEGPTPFYAILTPRRRLVFRAGEKFEPIVRNPIFCPLKPQNSSRP